MFIWRLKNFISTLTAVALLLTALLFAQSLRLTRFSGLDGRRTFYLQSTSSQAVVKERLGLFDFWRVKGESVSFPCADKEEMLFRLLESYGAVVVFEQSAGGSHSYYCLTQEWTDGVKIEGVFVNLHIAFNGEYCAVGAPIIFGGF